MFCPRHDDGKTSKRCCQHVGIFFIIGLQSQSLVVGALERRILWRVSPVKTASHKALRDAYLTERFECDEAVLRKSYSLLVLGNELVIFGMCTNPYP